MAAAISKLGACALALAATPAYAAEAVWSAPDACPQAPAFVAEIERFLRRPLGTETAVAPRIEGHVTREAARFSAQLRVETGRGTTERALAHDDCAELTEAAALVAALAIDPDLVLPEARPHDAEAASTTLPAVDPLPPPLVVAQAGLEPVAPPPAPARTVDRASPRRASRPLRPSVALLALFGSATLPGIGAGVGAQAGLGSGRFRLVARGSYWLPRFRELPEQNGAGIDVELWSAGLMGCVLALSGEVELALCGGPQLGQFSGSGNQRLDNARTDNQRWSGVSADLQLALPSRSGLTTLLGVELGRSLEQPRFGINRNGSAELLFEAAPFFAQAFLGLGWFR